MENAGNWEQKPLFNELTQGRELVKQLQVHLDPSYSEETRNMLVEKILSSFDKALSMVKWVSSVGEVRPTGATPVMSDSPRSDSGSPHSEDSDRRDIYKKRKTLPRWTEQIRVSSGTGLEGPLDDGYSWRKYGQKDILGAKYPRGYYRCTHRNVQGCLATKQVQRSDEDPSIFDVTYRGRHTCIQASHIIPAMGSMESSKQGLIQDQLHNHHHHHLLPQQKNEEQQKQQQQQAQEILFNFRTSLKVRTKELDAGEQQQQQQQLMSSAFSFPSTPIGPVKTENHIFSPPTVDHYFTGNLSPSFISPATSESNYFPVSPCRVNSFGGGGCQNLQTSESDFAEIISAATSGTNSPIVDLDFPMEFDPNFPFNSPDFFPS
ncbi:probable WRKY transcription factor 53 [Telopea speciosissima]|uniref:probable WRKY transcription factor 53 n=1 Tax=Telopea speciosissima TaxID=54955 RepID=UPI001CC57593|nr:probable WRKY transcription factor 53 [Telopea speciosissima]